MNGFLLRALVISLFTIGSIGIASAQQPAPEEKVDEKKDEQKAPPVQDDETKKKKAEEEKKEEAAPADASKLEPAQAEPAQAEPAQPAAEPAVEPAAPAAQDATIESKATDATTGPEAALSATAETKLEAGKAWKVSSEASFSLGAAFLNANTEGRKPSFGWAWDTIGSYTLLKLLDGNLDAFLRITMDQVLANTLSESAVGQTKEFEFFFRDIRLGVTEANLYKESVTGITASAGTEFFLPTSKTTIAAKRWLRWGLNARLGRTFEKLGPGDLSLGLGTIFRKDFGARQVNPDQDSAAAGICRATNIKDGDCIGSQKGSNFTFINDASIAYTWGPVSLGVSLAIYSIKYYRQDLGPDPEGVTVRESPYASNNTWSNLTLAEIEAAYAFNDNWSLSLSVTTYQNPYIYDTDSNSALRFPFFDSSSNAENLTTFDLAVGFVY